jgi:hypothetical protein
MQKSIIALLLLGSASVFANEAADEQFNRQAFAGSATRAEVNAGIAQAKAEGNLRFDEFTGGQQQANRSSRSRAEVRGEAVQAARSHMVHELY